MTTQKIFYKINELVDFCSETEIGYCIHHSEFKKGSSMIRPLLLNTQERRPIILLEFLNKTQELQISADGEALILMMEKDIKWLLVLSQLLIKSGNQYIQEYLTQKKKQDEAQSKIIDNLSV